MLSGTSPPRTPERSSSEMCALNPGKVVLGQASGKERAWTYWTDGLRIWLFTAEMSLPLSRERGAPVLAANAYIAMTAT